MITFNLVTGHLGAKGIQTDPPYELVGRFLSMELTRPSSAVYASIRRAIAAIEEGLQPEFLCDYNAHEVHLTTTSVTISEIEEYVGAAPQRCTISLEDFIKAFTGWHAFISSP